MAKEVFARNGRLLNTESGILKFDGTELSDGAGRREPGSGHSADVVVASMDSVTTVGLNDLWII